MRLNTTSFGLLLASCAIPIMPVKSQDGIKNADLGASDEVVVDFMRHAQAVYVFSAAAGCAKRPNERDLRLLEAEARQGLVGTLCNSDNWNWVTGGASCEMRDVGVLFRKDKDELILCFCSMHDMYYDHHVGCRVEGTFGQKIVLGWLKERPWEIWKQRFAQAEMRK